MFFSPNQEENNYWISYTDLVTGFMIVFVIITLLLFNRNSEENLLNGKYAEVENVFKKEFDKIDGVEISEEATIRFLINEDDHTELFKSKPEEPWEPTDYFKDLLEETIPLYLDVICNIYENNLGHRDSIQIKELRIEGHTDSTGSYIDNLKISSARASKVQSIILNNKYFQDSFPTDFKKFVRHNSIACGYSYSRTLDKNGKLILNDEGQQYDPDKSRRVELRVILEHKK